MSLDAEPSLPPDLAVVVILSTYNGERFVAEQLKSILVQLPSRGRILIRDDGSRDDTVRIIGAIGDPRIALERGDNIGFARSFLTLLQRVEPTADMVLLSDQDDVWLPGKLARAYAALTRCGPGPALYGSAQMLADAQLRPLQPTRPWRWAPSFEGALVCNVITGCTAALNREALALLQRAGVPDDVHFHDWWLYLVVSALGRVVYDPQPSLLYRQHGANQIGHGAGLLGREWARLRFILRRDWVGILLGQTLALWRHYRRDLPAPHRQLLQRCFDLTPDSIRPRWHLVWALRRWRETWFDEIAFRALVALWRLGIWPTLGRRLRPGRR